MALLREPEPEPSVNSPPNGAKARAGAGGALVREDAERVGTKPAPLSEASVRATTAGEVFVRTASEFLLDAVPEAFASEATERRLFTKRCSFAS